MNEKKCIICNTSSDTTPVIQFNYKGTDYYICSMHMPVLIHNSTQLESHLPEWKGKDLE